MDEPADPGYDCFLGQLSASNSGAVDDVVIGYEMKYIDGINGTLGLANQCYVYVRTSTNSTLLGVMIFDQDDFASMSAADGWVGLGIEQ